MKTTFRISGVSSVLTVFAIMALSGLTVSIQTVQDSFAQQVAVIGNSVLIASPSEPSNGSGVAYLFQPKKSKSTSLQGGSFGNPTPTPTPLLRGRLDRQRLQRRPQAQPPHGRLD